MLGPDIAYMCAKFHQSSFSRSGDIIGAHQNLNGSRDLTTPISGTICRPWAGTCYDQSWMDTKYEVSTITCNEDIGNAKIFEPPFGGLRGNAQGSSMARQKAHCRLPISDSWTFSLALKAEALLSKICRNRRFLKGWVTLSTNFR